MKKLRARVISQEKGIYRVKSECGERLVADGSSYLAAKREKFKEIATMNKANKKRY